MNINNVLQVYINNKNTFDGYFKFITQSIIIFLTNNEKITYFIAINRSNIIIKSPLQDSSVKLVLINQIQSFCTNEKKIFHAFK